MPIDELKLQIARLPEQPGVYVFLDAAGETLYIGKARVLRDRVRSYLGARGQSPRLDALLRDATGLETTVTDSVVEALALENRLIKQRNPRYNILLRDDKTYPYLQLTVNERAPRVLVARRVERDGTVYAGPFMPAALARRTMGLAHRLFGIRSCNEVIDGQRPRPCLEYDIGRCLAPCVEAVCSIDRYDRAVDQARLLLEGKQEELVAGLRAEMGAAAVAEQYERAAHLRDAIRTIETLRDRQQKLETMTGADHDAFGVKTGPSGAVVAVFQMRGGRVVDRHELSSDEAAAGPELSVGASDADVLCAAIQQFYADRLPPPEILVPIELPADEHEAFETWLGGRLGRRVRIVAPRRGDKRGLLDLVVRNAAVSYAGRFSEGAGAAFEALESLRVVLGLAALPRRIECFDISTLQGTDTVASLVVCVEGRMRRGEYRKFKIRGGPGLSALGPRPIAAATTHAEASDATPGPKAQAPGPPVILDDFASMHEVVQRRYRHVLEQGGPFPDLIVIDGGKGQLSAAYAALYELGLDRLVAVGLAKQEELLFTRERAEGLALAPESAALRLLQRIRDEAHRFAVTFHRGARRRHHLRSALDEVRGIGAHRRRLLLERFGSLAGVRRASREDLTAAVGARAAAAVWEHLHGVRS